MARARDFPSWEGLGVGTEHFERGNLWNATFISPLIEQIIWMFLTSICW